MHKPHLQEHGKGDTEPSDEMPCSTLHSLVCLVLHNRPSLVCSTSTHRHSITETAYLVTLTEQTL